MIDSDQSDSGKTLKKFLSSDYNSRLEIATYWIERNKKSSNAAIQAILGKSLNNKNNNNNNNNNIITLRNATRVQKYWSSHSRVKSMSELLWRNHQNSQNRKHLSFPRFVVDIDVDS